MCVYGHFDTRASNGPEPLFQQCSSRMSESLLLTYTDMLCSVARIPCHTDRTSGNVHVEFIVDLEHMFYILLRTSDFVPK